MARFAGCGSQCDAFPNVTRGTAAVSTAPGALATFTFTGPSVRWIGGRAPWSGIANVLLDGGLVAEVDHRPLPWYAEEKRQQGAFATLLAAGKPVAYADPKEGRNSWVGVYGIRKDDPPQPLHAALLVFM